MTVKEWSDNYTKRVYVFSEVRAREHVWYSTYMYRLNEDVRKKMAKAVLEGKWFYVISEINGLISVSKDEQEIIFESGESLELKYMEEIGVEGKPFHEVTEEELIELGYMV